MTSDDNAGYYFTISMRVIIVKCAAEEIYISWSFLSPRNSYCFFLGARTSYPLYLFQYAARSGETIEGVRYMERHNDKIDSYY